MVDLSTTYLGLNLKNPLVASASPLSKKLEGVQKLEAAGVSAIVMYSLFEEQIIHESLELDHYLNRTSVISAEALNALPDTGTYSIGPGKYLDYLSLVKKTVNIPVIGSLNGVSRSGWSRYARFIEEAGADALELNLYYLESDAEVTAQELENDYIELVETVCSSIKIPLAVKLSPFLTALPNFARRLAGAGANGLVLFNRFYQPDFDLDNLEIFPNLTLSNSNDLRLPLHWISLLYGKVDVDLALTSGVHTHLDVLKAMMAGAKIAMMASEILKNGYGAVGATLSNLQSWMEQHEYVSIQQMQGSMSQQSVNDAAVFERINYMRVLNSYRNLP